jgi:hypothetical protein
MGQQQHSQQLQEQQQSCQHSHQQQLEAQEDFEGSGSEVEGPVPDDKYIKGTRLVINGWFQACRCAAAEASTRTLSGAVDMRLWATSCLAHAPPSCPGQHQQQQQYPLICAALAAAPCCRGCNEPTAHTTLIARRDVPLCPR